MVFVSGGGRRVTRSDVDPATNRRAVEAGDRHWVGPVATGVPSDDGERHRHLCPWTLAADSKPSCARRFVAVTSAGRRRTGGATLSVELVGLAGVGKSHLRRQLVLLLGDRCFDLLACRPSLRHVSGLPRAVYRALRLSWYLFRSSDFRPTPPLRTIARFVLYAWREEFATRSQVLPDFVLIEEGWFQKLRWMRKVAGPTVTYGELPARVRRGFLRADVVLFLTADPMVVCERKLVRSGKPVTPESLERQYQRSGELGQWEEDCYTRIDLQQASAEMGLHHVEVAYGPDFDEATDLLPLLERLRQAKATGLKQ